MFYCMVTKSVFKNFFFRDPPEATGDEPEDFEYEAPKIYEPVNSKFCLLCLYSLQHMSHNISFIHHIFDI